MVATAIFLVVGIDRWGRKKSLIGGAAWMASMMFIIGAVLATNPPNPEATSVSSASTAMVAMIYLYVIGYSASWGPVPWVYLGEVSYSKVYPYPVQYANIICSDRSSQLVFAPTVSVLVLPRNGYLTSSSLRLPLALSTRLAGRLFLMFGIFCFAMGTFVIVFFKETKGRTLEEMDLIFGAVDEQQRRADVEHTLHKTQVMHEEHAETTDTPNTTETSETREHKE